MVWKLKIEDKININDEYILFLLNNPSKNVIELRNKLNISRFEFTKLIGVSITSIARWENGNNHILREKYEKIKLDME